MFNVIINGTPGNFIAILIDVKSGQQFLRIERDERSQLIDEIEDLTTDL